MRTRLDTILPVHFALHEYDSAFARFLFETTRELARARDAVLGQIEFEAMPSTVGSRVQSREGMDLELEPAKVGFEITSDWAAVREADLSALVSALDQAAEKLAKEYMGQWLATMNKVTEATGNVVDAEGGGLTFEHLYEMLEKIEMDVDENDELEMPALVMHPDTVKTLPELTPEQEKKLADLKEHKREEALARRRRRRLS